MTSWRSVIDVLLYDYAEKYFKLDLKRGMKVTQDYFEVGAEILKNQGCPEAIKFIKWYKGKMRTLKEEFPSLFGLRDTSVHRGGKKLDASRKHFYALRKQRGLVELKAGEELSIDGMPETVLVSECERAYKLMTSIVAEARQLFV